VIVIVIVIVAVRVRVRDHQALESDTSYPVDAL
jgi:hypothetical protein